MSLDKVLRLAQEPQHGPDAAALVRAASDSLERLAVLLAKQADDDEDDDDPDDDGDDDSTAEGDTDHDYWDKNGKKKKPLPGKKKAKKGGTVKASQALAMEAMLALSALQGGETLTLSVLSQKQREKPSAHTIAGSTDFPIPDEAHLTAAVREYHAGNLAGHSREEVAAHIRSQAKRLGKTVDLATPAQEVIMLARGGAPAVAMEHGPVSGEHDHPHRVVNVHSHKHTHNGDARHGCGETYGGMY